MAVKKAVFLDKDGTLILDVPYNVDPDLIRLSDRMICGLRKLHHHGYELIVISNQPGIAMGYFGYDQLDVAERKIGELLLQYDVPITGFYYCPHHPAGVIEKYRGRCNCRKPASGLFETAAKANGIDLFRSWMIGDILNDVEAGNTVGCRTILINNGNETEWEIRPGRVPDCIRSDVDSAADYILKLDSLTLKKHGNRLFDINKKV